MLFENFPDKKLKEVKDLKPGDYLLTNECLVLDISGLLSKIFSFMFYKVN